VLELAGSTGMVVTRRSVRRAGVRRGVLRAYAYQCAMRGFDGGLGVTRWGLRRRMCAGTARLARTW